MDNNTPKLVIDVNRNETKKGIKVQFNFPTPLQGDAKAEMTQKIQNKLNKGLAQYEMIANVDTDVPYDNTIGFLISIDGIRMLIKKALGQGGNEQTEEPPQPPTETSTTDV